MNFFSRKGQQEPGRADPKAATVLIVEDSSSDALLTAQALERIGITYFEIVRSGEEALALLETQDFQVALIDFNLPRMNGLQLLESLAKQYPNVKVIVVTGVRDEKVAVAALKLGAADYVSKDEFLTSGIIRSLQATLKGTESERQALLSNPGMSVATALVELDWLIDDVKRTGLREHNLLAQDDENSSPPVFYVTKQFLTQSFEQFPEAAGKEEEDLLQSLLENGASPRAFLVTFREALRGMEVVPEGALPVNPTLLAARVLRRFVEAYQMHLALQP